MMALANDVAAVAPINFAAYLRVDSVIVFLSQD